MMLAGSCYFSTPEKIWISLVCEKYTQPLFFPFLKFLQSTKISLLWDRFSQSHFMTIVAEFLSFAHRLPWRTIAKGWLVTNYDLNSWLTILGKIFDNFLNFIIRCLEINKMTQFYTPKQKALFSLVKQNLHPWVNQNRPQIREINR